MYFTQILIAQPLLYLIETTASKQGRVWKTNFWNQPEVCARRFYLSTCSFGFPSTISLALFIKPWRLKKIASQIFCTISLAYKALLSENCSKGHSLRDSSRESTNWLFYAMVPWNHFGIIRTFLCEEKWQKLV